MTLRDKYFTIGQAAKYMDVTRQTVSRWIAEGKIRVERIGREALIEKPHIYRYEQQILDDKVGNSIINYAKICAEVGYDYSEGDIIELKKIRQGRIFVFSVTRRDGKKEEVNVKMHIGMKRKAKGYGLDIRPMEIWQTGHKAPTGKQVRKT